MRSLVSLFIAAALTSAVLVAMPTSDASATDSTAQGPDLECSYSPELWFHDDCVEHDLCYGTLGASKETCDAAFLVDMLETCRTGLPLWEYTLYYERCVRLAKVYYARVQSAFGFIAFDRAQERALREADGGSETTRVTTQVSSTSSPTSTSTSTLTTSTMSTSTTQGTTTTRPTTTVEIDFNAACVQHYGSGVYAQADDPDDPFGWECRRDLGGLDLLQYCLDSGYNDVALAENNAFGWRCHGDVERVGMDLNAACVQQYDTGAYAEAKDWNNPYSWVCLQSGTELGGLDLNSYCQSIGYDNAVLISDDAGGWSCERVKLADIDVNRVCRDQYSSNAYAHTDNEDDPFSWVCRRDHGGLDLNQYCQSIGYDRAVLASTDAWGWRCEATA